MDMDNNYPLGNKKFPDDSGEILEIRLAHLSICADAKTFVTQIIGYQRGEDDRRQPSEQRMCLIFLIR